jgi:hypothetical protein
MAVRLVKWLGVTIRGLCGGGPSVRWLGWVFSLFMAGALGTARVSVAQESPYFVTYDHYLEEPGNLEVEYRSTFGSQRGPSGQVGGNDFHAYWTELEYGAKAWWTTEFYLEGQSTFGDSTVFTGFRWENRFRPLKHEHFVNPVLYIEYERVNGADKILKEIEGHDVAADHGEPNARLRQETNNELEFKLILSSTFKGWNVSQNTIAVKNLSNEPWEFGYALGASRPLRLAAAAQRCNFCAQNFAAGAEMYGGLGDRYHFGLKDTSQYVAPVVSWNLPSGWNLKVSPGFGLNENSHGFLLRWGVSYEFAGFGERVSRLFGRNR